MPHTFKSNALSHHTVITSQMCIADENDGNFLQCYGPCYFPQAGLEVVSLRFSATDVQSVVFFI